MTDAERSFVITCVGVIPVLLLALVIEARLFRYGRDDAVPAVKPALAEKKATTQRFIYVLWRVLVAYRRNAFSTILKVTVVVGLSVAEFFGLVALWADISLGTRGTLLVLAISVGLWFVAVAPVLGQLVRQSSELGRLEGEVRAEFGKARHTVTLSRRGRRLRHK